MGAGQLIFAYPGAKILLFFQKYIIAFAADWKLQPIGSCSWLESAVELTI
jgi:hypothetical protein